MQKVLISVVAFVVYFLLFQLGSLFTIPFGFASPIWPLSGLMLGLYLCYGNPILVGAALSAMLCYTMDNSYVVNNTYSSALFALVMPVTTNH